MLLSIHSGYSTESIFNTTRQLIRWEVGVARHRYATHF